MKNTHESNEDVLKNQRDNAIQEQEVNIRNQSLIDNKEEVDLENVDLTNITVRRGVRNRLHEEAATELILRAPTLLKGPNFQRYTQRPYKPSTALQPIPKRFRMPIILKYDGTKDPNEVILAFIIIDKGNYLSKDEIEFA
ncbi:hypothetical protein HAX54_032732 [Datura stramonium]|uniref:Uncharacterized protein n=1 Tax=Datura stramonium TaxID=4076 RepID=A0ABS8SCS3_DATST|nr:hypothetical protein [Datura stramonium]